jgi:tetratricopeptide (TPR) repeat protein
MLSRSVLSLLSIGLLLAACDDAVGEHRRRGEAAMAAGQYADAFTAFSHARELAPHDAAVQRGIMRARAYAIAEQPGRVNPEVLDDARYEAQLLADTDKPHEAVYLTALGNVLARKGDLGGARAKIDAALKSDPASAVAHTALGLLLAGKRETAAKARVELEAALKTKPDHAPALVALGQIELGEGDAAGAASHLEAALRAGDDVPALVLLGKARLQQQRPAEAVEQLRRAADLDPRNADALGTLGQALLAMGKADEAERALRAAAQLHSDEPTQIALGFALVHQRKLDPALGVFAQVLAGNGAAAPALFGAASASEGLGKNPQALDLYKRLLALPAEGSQKPVVLDLQKEARGHVAALEAAASASAAAPSASAAAGPPAPRR